MRSIPDMLSDQVKVVSRHVKFADTAICVLIGIVKRTRPAPHVKPKLKKAGCKLWGSV